MNRLLVIKRRLLSRRKHLLEKAPSIDLKDHPYKSSIMELDNTIALIDSIMQSHGG